MNNLFLYLVYETFTNGYLANILYIISLFAILCGVLVIVTKNPVVSVLFLIGLFGSISVYLIMIGLRFIGLAYLVVYVGAISILFLFILMLINIRISELQSNTLNIIALAITITIALNYLLFKLLPYDIAISSNDYDSNDISFNLCNWWYYFNILNSLNNQLFFVSSNLWDGNLADTDHIASIGSIMYTNFNMWLIMASFILLLAMVGCIVITLKPVYLTSSTVRVNSPSLGSPSGTSGSSINFKNSLKINLHSKRNYCTNNNNNNNSSTGSNIHLYKKF